MSSDTSSKMVGQVKWFNNKAGYGFITVKSDDESKDIFAHYSNINVDNSQYKYLVQGEYVEFLLEKTDSGKHEFQATSIKGINGGPIMCETRKTVTSDGSVRPRKTFRAPLPGRRSDVSDDGFKRVVRKTSTKPKREESVAE